MIDLDHFGDINATHGHPAADHVLRALAKTLRSEVREHDHVARYGGDEFVIAIPGISGADLHTVAERIRHRIRGLVVTIPHSDHPAPVSGLTASIGGAHYPITTETDNPQATDTAIDELLRAADSACYQAKHNGRDRVELLPHTLRDHHLPVGTDDAGN